MFTGIIEDTGTVVDVRAEGFGRRLTLRTALPLAEVALGDSIACNGACLTAESFDGDTFTVVAGKETLDKTTTGTLGVGSRVHLERALRLGDRLDGHLVQGHVDGVGRIVSLDEQGESWVLWVDVGPALAPFVAVKGSLTLDGVSLTVNEVDGTTARINLIPHTVRVTRLSDLRPGDGLNVEVDVLARYVERMLAWRAEPGGLTLARLKEQGF